MAASSQPGPSFAPSPPANPLHPRPNFDLLSSLFIPPPPPSAPAPSPAKTAPSFSQHPPDSQQSPPRRRRRLLKRLDSDDDDENKTPHPAPELVEDSQCTPSQPQGVPQSTAPHDVIVIDDSPQPAHNRVVYSAAEHAVAPSQQTEVVDLTGSSVPEVDRGCRGDGIPSTTIPTSTTQHAGGKPVTNPFAVDAVHRNKPSAVLLGLVCVRINECWGRTLVETHTMQVSPSTQSTCPIATTRPVQHNPTVEPGTRAFLQQCAAQPAATNRQQLLQVQHPPP